MKKNENGRSMVEMLGVLAIIGVLSAGALAGYSKAMTQHKLNKHTQEISYLLATAIYNQDKIIDTNSQEEYISALDALGAFTWTTNLQNQGESTYKIVTDSLQNTISFEHSAGGGTAFVVILNKSDFKVKVCYNYINIFKNLSNELDVIYVTRSKTGQAKARNTYIGKTCTSEKCLETITNTDISELCGQVCDDADRCVLYALWGYPASTVANLLRQ